MEEFFLVGEPIFNSSPKREFCAPISQIDLCLEVLRETQDETEIINRLREEFLAIVFSLKQMGIDFRIVYAHKNRIDMKAIGICVQQLGCRLAGFPEDYFSPYIAYPRDFTTVLPGLILVNPKAAKLRVSQKDGCKILSSPFGEGGRVLTSQGVMLVSERLVEEENHSRPVRPQDFEKITQEGINIGTFPFPLAQIFSASRRSDRVFINDHIDRVGCLVHGESGGLHLVVDPLIETAVWKGKGRTPPWIRRTPEETREKITDSCESLGINVHYPKTLKVPYSLNLIQFRDDRVLMTGGDDEVEKLITEIIGKDKIFKTPIPIRFYPVWAYAGIRCLVSEAPVPLFKNISS